MSEEKERENEDGIGINLPGFSGSVDRQISSDLVKWIGPHLKWIIYSIGAALLIIATFYGVSLVWN